MDAGTGTDQTGKRYWQRIEDRYCKIKPKTASLIARSYRSLQGRWELMKPHCARWSAAMDQVRVAPPSGSVESDYVSIFLIYLGLFVCLLLYCFVYYAMFVFVGVICRLEVQGYGRFQRQAIPI